ncbi:hypothetical protein SF23_17330, partial [Streptomyces sp. MBRL 10]
MAASGFGAFGFTARMTVVPVSSAGRAAGAGPAFGARNTAVRSLSSDGSAAALPEPEPESEAESGAGAFGARNTAVVSLSPEGAASGRGARKTAVRSLSAGSSAVSPP